MRRLILLTAVMVALLPTRVDAQRRTPTPTATQEGQFCCTTGSPCALALDDWVTSRSGGTVYYTGTVRSHATIPVRDVMVRAFFNETTGANSPLSQDVLMPGATGTFAVSIVRPYWSAVIEMCGVEDPLATPRGLPLNTTAPAPTDPPTSVPTWTAPAVGVPTDVPTDVPTAATRTFAAWLPATSR